MYAKASLFCWYVLIAEGINYSRLRKRFDNKGKREKVHVDIHKYICMYNPRSAQGIHHFERRKTRRTTKNASSKREVLAMAELLKWKPFRHHIEIYRCTVPPSPPPEEKGEGQARIRILLRISGQRILRRGWGGLPPSCPIRQALSRLLEGDGLPF